METKFTPGPWARWDGHNDVYAVGPNFRMSPGSISGCLGKICDCDGDDFGVGRDYARFQPRRLVARFHQCERRQRLDFSRSKNPDARIAGRFLALDRFLYADCDECRRYECRDVECRRTPRWDGFQYRGQRQQSRPERDGDTAASVHIKFAARARHRRSKSQLTIRTLLRFNGRAILSISPFCNAPTKYSFCPSVVVFLLALIWTSRTSSQSSPLLCLS